MSLVTSSNRGTFLTLNIIDLGEFPIPEESVAFTAVNALNVHAQGHNDLEVSVRGSLILNSDFYCLVRNLHHLEVILHLLFKDRVV